MTVTRHCTMMVVSLTAIVVVNLLVLAKYAPRVGMPWVILAAGYLGVVTAGVYGSRRRPGSMTALRPLLFWTTVVLAALLYLLILDRVPLSGLRVDRWSAMTSFNSSLMHGQFPYLARTHLGSQLWGLPVAYLLGLPFQWLGDVGYLQVFVFVCFAVVCQRSWGRQFDLVWPFALFATSPAYLWEVAVRSDLTSDALLCVLYLCLCARWRDRKTPAAMVTLGALGGLLACTRVVFALPCLVYFIGYFRRDQLKAGALLAGAGAAVFAGVLTPFVMWAPRFFLENNPLAFQVVLSPVPLRVAVAVVSLLAGYWAKDFRAKCLAGGLVILGGAMAVFMLQVQSRGLDRALFGNLFDISYFDLALPLLLVPLLFSCPAAVHLLEGGDRPGPSPAETGR